MIQEIADRIYVELNLAHESSGIVMAISKYADDLRRTPFSTAFALIQRNSVDAVIISVAKLFELEGRNPNFGIRSCIAAYRRQKKLRVCNSSMLPALKSFLVHRSRLEEKDGFDSTLIAKSLLDYFEETCPHPKGGTTPENDRDLVAIYVLRDKRVAHGDLADIKAYPQTDFEGIQSLLAYAATFFHVVHLGLSGHTDVLEVKVEAYDPTKSRTFRELDKHFHALFQNGR